MYFYNAFGVNIDSEIRIPRFIERTSGVPDVSIRLGKVRHLMPEEKHNERLFKNQNEQVFLFWKQIGWYMTEKGSDILVELLPDVEESLIYLPLTGIVLAILLQQRGNLVLHASAVSINEQGVTFVGRKGQGKSTMAALLYERGHPMISDDVVLIERNEEGQHIIVPGFPNFKLMPEAVNRVLGDDPETLPEIYAGAEKRYRSSADNFSVGVVPLKAIYAPEEGDEISEELLSPQQALKVLISNTYSSRDPKILLHDKEAVMNLHQCTKLLGEVPVYKLTRPKSFELMNDVAELIEANCATPANAK
jgi:hypothetical protein